MSVRNQTRQTFVTSFSPFCKWTERFAYGQSKISCLPIRAKCRHFRTICEQTLDNSPTDPTSSSKSRHGVATLNNCRVVLFACSHYLSTNFFRMTFHVKGPWGNIRIRFLGNWKFFQSSGRIPGFEHISVNVNNILAYLTFSLSTTQSNMVKEWCRLSQINVLHEYFPHRENILLLSRQFYNRPHTQTGKALFSVNEQAFPFGTIS